MKIKELINYWNNRLKENKIDESLLKIQLLLAYELGVSKEYLFINSDKDVDEKIKNSFEEKVKKILENEPFQYILGFQEFMGLKFFVDKRCINT